MRELTENCQIKGENGKAGVKTGVCYPFPPLLMEKTCAISYDTGADKGDIHMVSDRDYAPLSNPQGR